MADLLDIRDGTNPGRALATFGSDGSLALAGPIIATDQATAPTQVPGATVLYTQGGALFAKAPDGTVVKLQTSSAGPGTTWPLSGLGLLAASIDPAMGMNGANISNGQAFFARVYIPANTAVTNLWGANRDAGTYDGATLGNSIGIYTDAGVLVDQIVTQNDIWTKVGWVGGALSAGAIAAQTAGRFVYIAVLVRGMTVANVFSFMTSANDSAGNLVWFNAGPAGAGATNKRAFYIGGLTALPASFTPATAGTSTTFVPLVAVT